jgi:hypothetical protein
MAGKVFLLPILRPAFYSHKRNNSTKQIFQLPSNGPCWKKIGKNKNKAQWICIDFIQHWECF